MIRRESEMIIVPRSQHWQGCITHLLDKNELSGKGSLFAKISVKPGSKVPFHCHAGDFEVYYILRGQGRISDNGVELILHTGDVQLTKSQESHSIENIGDEDLEFIAVIIND